MHQSLTLLLLLVLTVQAKVTIQNLEDDFSPKDELDYVNYLKLILGREDLPTKISPSLMELTSNKRYSPDSAVQRVVIVFIPFAPTHDKQHQSESGKEIEMKGKLLQELIFQTPQLFIVTSLPAREEERVHQLIEAYSKEGKVVHMIRGEAQEVKRLGEMMNLELSEYQSRIRSLNR